MTEISDAAAAAREQAREATGQFGTQEHTAPDTEVTAAAKSARDLRIDEMVAKTNTLREQLRQEEAKLLPELRSELWAKTPANVTAIDFEVIHNRDLSFVSFIGLRVWDPEFGTEEYIDFADVDGDLYNDFASFFTQDTIGDYIPEDEERYGVYSLNVGKDATRQRLLDLQAELAAETPGRSSKQIGDDIDDTVKRYLRQLGAEEGWESIELDWASDGQPNLRAVAAMKGGERFPVEDGSEAAWAAGHLIAPSTDMEAPNGVKGPFIVTIPEQEDSL